MPSRLSSPVSLATIYCEFWQFVQTFYSSFITPLSNFMWPEHYPNTCPPLNATDAGGNVYRFLLGSNTVSDDFLSYYLLGKADNCQSRGLSVYTSFSGVEEARKAIPAFRNKKCARANLSGSAHGKVLHTPSQKCAQHYTWWLPESLDPMGITWTIV